MQSKRDLNGILLLDKPLTLSSNQALTIVKKLFSAKKAGHTGSLDPLATGMLPICFGEATKFSQFLLEADKSYYVEATLGIRTETGDAEGAVVAKRPIPKNIKEGLLEQVLERFKGEIAQVPSMYSALKFQGKPLYYYARQGIEIDRPHRMVNIKSLELLECTDERFIITVTCSKGTYIRTLVEDIGEALGCGAFVSLLRRTAVMPYEQDKMFALSEIEDESKNNPSQMDARLLPIDSALRGWPEVTLTESMTFYMKQGQSVTVSRTPTSGFVRLVTQNGDFIGVGEATSDGRLAPRRLVRN